jgi:hypothetical protein
MVGCPLGAGVLSLLLASEQPRQGGGCGTPHQKRKAIRRRAKGEELLAEIGRSYNVSGWTIARLAP